MNADLRTRGRCEERCGKRLGGSQEVNQGPVIREELADKQDRWVKQDLHGFV
jgi:hypothetical protein